MNVLVFSDAIILLSLYPEKQIPKGQIMMPKLAPVAIFEEAKSLFFFFLT